MLAPNGTRPIARICVLWTLMAAPNVSAKETVCYNRITSLAWVSVGLLFWYSELDCLPFQIQNPSAMSKRCTSARVAVVFRTSLLAMAPRSARMATTRTRDIALIENAVTVMRDARMANASARTKNATESTTVATFRTNLDVFATMQLNSSATVVCVSPLTCGATTRRTATTLRMRWGVVSSLLTFRRSLALSISCCFRTSKL